MKKILVVEDEEIIRKALTKLLKKNNFDVSEAGSISEAQTFDFNLFNLIISDLRLPGGQGTDLINLAKNTPVLIMTSYASMRSAVDAMKMGAVDYIAKPFDHNEMIETITRLLSQTPVSSATEPLPNIEKMPTTKIIGHSKIMKEVSSSINKVAPTDVAALIYGETGTGKELVAKEIHAKSHRSNRPLISINCAAIPENLIETELFGHEKGAFAGADTARIGLIAAADGGTLFLDEIGELPLGAQARLLRVLQEQEIRPIGAIEPQKIDIRLIAATHYDLKKLCIEKKFREDLFFRINVFEINLPPLRDRGDDIITLAKTFLESSYNKIGGIVPEILPKTQQLLLKHLWPGNVRELKNAIQRAAIINSNSDPLQPEHLELKVTPESFNTTDSSTTTHESVNKEDLSLDEYFIEFVQENQDKLNETSLAKKLGISRKNLWERRQKLSIPRKKTKKK